ncbi:hypothetical protein Cgig2_014606 [Carnegiea gigantea]|uniref:Uncharacterized protein n=1 Tax=Carnegiea gigantea TaxID=171969 RepID=A0A9Q1L0C8_9CARY|nr:hypothetical protein Cgig2_014606 [Carnegiea gigantea]
MTKNLLQLKVATKVEKGKTSPDYLGSLWGIGVAEPQQLHIAEVTLWQYIKFRHRSAGLLLANIITDWLLRDATASSISSLSNFEVPSTPNMSRHQFIFRCLSFLQFSKISMILSLKKVPQLRSRYIMFGQSNANLLVVSSPHSRYIGLNEGGVQCPRKQGDNRRASLSCR